MKRQTIYILCIAVLLLLNIGLTLLLLTGRKPGLPGGPRQDAAAYIIRELNLDASQQQQFEKLREEHRQHTRPLHDSLMATRDRLYSSASYADTALARTYAAAMGDLHARLDWYTYDHFRQVKALCNDQQQQRFDNIIREALKMMAPGKRPPEDRQRPQH